MTVWVILTIVCTSDVCAPRQAGIATYTDQKYCEKGAARLSELNPKQKYKCDWWKE